MLKTIACGNVRPEHVGHPVTLAGWVHRRRDHGGLIFIDLRDSTGLVQVVFNPADNASVHHIAEQFRSEWVVQVTGAVRHRPAGTENPNLPTGHFEVVATGAHVLNAAKTPPFDVTSDAALDELLRLKYRYLDLRRPVMANNIRLRHRIVKHIRDFLDDRAFVEVETPILIKSTPEGARDYLVPSRIRPGSFYALPQSPQQLKQLLMVAGMDRYFQIARCFRDEDPRADRQPEFTQLDLEMAFVEPKDIVDLMEELYLSIVKHAAPGKRVLTTPIPRLTYAEAMSRFGSDKPDMRFDLELTDLTDIVKDTQFQVFKNVTAAGGIVKGFAVPGMAGVSRRETDELIAMARTHGLGGLVTIAIDASLPSIDALTASHFRTQARGLALGEVQAMSARTGAKPGDLILIAAGPQAKVEPGLGQVRLDVGHRLGLADANVLAFCFILDFPLVEWDDDARKWDFVHHPFTSARDEDWHLLETDPGKARSKAYDLACNGSELAGGSARIHQRERQEQVFRLLGYDKATMDERFGHLLEAFEYGAPPHGGFAGGIDRLTATLADWGKNIRDTIAFPKTQEFFDPLFGSPAPVSDAQLKELHIRVVDEKPAAR
ncbi:MAG: aspartate--tRNA ligase [SAR202 cluster bacterium]|nr:aspartate--tRNA ligase [SAR202 cluster bacterium]